MFQQVRLGTFRQAKRRKLNLCGGLGCGQRVGDQGSGKGICRRRDSFGRFSNERTIYKYICGFEAYPWNGHARAYVQLRAWARLLTVSKNFQRVGWEVPYGTGGELGDNRLFLRDVIERHLVRPRDDWHPDDYTCYPEESRVAKDKESLPLVIEFLRRHDLPWEKTNLLGRKN